MSDVPLELRGVTIRYGSRTLLEDVTLDLPRGSVYALLGRNGAGKTSLVRCALGLRSPDAGEARLFGADAVRSRARAMTRVGVLPEQPDAPAAMTADVLSRFCSRLYPAWDARGVSRRLDRLGVPRDVPFGRLSKGEKGSLLFALALAPAPDLLVLDDPTLGLDPVARRELYEELVGELADRGTTVFLTTHDLSGIEGIAGRVGVLARGRLAVDESLEHLKSRFRRITYANEIVPSRTYGTELDLFDSARVRVRGWGVDAVVTNFDDERFERFRALEGVRGATAEALPLEEIFLAVTGVPGGEVRRAS